MFDKQNGWMFRTRLDQPVFSTNDTDSVPVSGAPETNADIKKADEVPDEDQAIKKTKLGGKPSKTERNK